jgi:Short C-terminal domain
MGLIGGMARTAVVAGTATAVSNRVSRRQLNRWSNQEQQQQAYHQPTYAEQPQYQQAAPPPPAPPAPAPSAPAPSGQADMLAQLKQLGELKDAGVLTEEEFATQKARILAGTS